MKKEEIHLWDVQRILFGQAPPQFLLEVFIRSLLIYIVAIVVMRWMGKRMNGQLTIIELSVMVMLGAIVSVPMQVPDRGILQGVVVLLTTLALLRGINWLDFKRTGFEKLLHGQVSTLVKDGVLQKSELEKAGITNQQLFEVLREKNIYSLGKVKRVYLEGCGLFSVYEGEGAPGLSLYPPDDKKIFEECAEAVKGVQACTFCGTTTQVPAKPCPTCGKQAWVNAIN